MARRDFKVIRSLWRRSILPLITKPETAVFERDDVNGAGIVQLDADDRVVRFVEKPPAAEASGRLINGGLYVLSPTILPLIEV